MDKEIVIYTSDGILFSYKKKNEILPFVDNMMDLPFVDNMDGPQEHYTKCNKSERERQIPYNVSYKWNLNAGIPKNGAATAPNVAPTKKEGKTSPPL